MNYSDSTRATIRLASILKCFTHDRSELSALEISRICNIPTATTYRILAGLTSSHFLERNGRTGKYRIGIELFLIGNLYAETMGIVTVSEPVLELINDLTGEATSLGILDKENVVLIHLNEPKHSYRILRHIGTTVPAYASASGKALLSKLNDTDIDIYYPEEALKRITPKTIATRSELKRELAQIRKSGIAFDKEGGYEGVEGIAALIYDSKNNPLGAASIPIPVFKLNRKLRREYSMLIKKACYLISHKLGFRKETSTIHTIEDLKNWWITRESSVK